MSPCLPSANRTALASTYTKLLAKCALTAELVRIGDTDLSDDICGQYSAGIAFSLLRTVLTSVLAVLGRSCPAKIVLIVVQRIPIRVGRFVSLRRRAMPSFANKAMSADFDLRASPQAELVVAIGLTASSHKSFHDIAGGISRIGTIGCSPNDTVFRDFVVRQPIKNPPLHYRLLRARALRRLRRAALR